ncbi:hypothetical protein QF038_001943 [Pseudarthrobacter sp. W1I19]|nr:hypothetical protein [Pseudarthrobacter sp. W1I19]
MIAVLYRAATERFCPSYVSQLLHAANIGGMILSRLMGRTLCPFS